MSKDNKKTEKVRSLRGMNDLLPNDAIHWEQFENTVRNLVRSYGYVQIRTPILEKTVLFKRGIGEITDIVEKEMYSFIDTLNGEYLTLRPENTAAIVRASIEHNLLYDGPKRLWYIGPMFRHERPQRGRYRQFHQVGIEALGFAGPDIDAEIIMISYRLWDTLGLKNIRLELNSLGDAEERALHREALTCYFRKYINSFDLENQRKLCSNPLRILDTKDSNLQDIVNTAPKLMDFLGNRSLSHFQGLQERLLKNKIPFTLNPRLVRGLDYYNLTVFEWISDSLGSQGAVSGGGRYDSLIESLGGKPAPACGWAIGIERIIELLKSKSKKNEITSCEIYVIYNSETASITASIIGEHLRSSGFNVIVHANVAFHVERFKSQMKRADASGARCVVIVRDSEMTKNIVSIKPLRGFFDYREKNVEISSIVSEINNIFSKNVA